MPNESGLPPQNTPVNITQVGGGNVPSGVLPVTFSGPTLSTLVVSASAGGDNVLIPGVVGQVINVYRLVATVDPTGTMTFKDGSSVALSGPMSGATAIVLDVSGNPWYTTTAGNGFVVNLSGGAAIDGTIYFTQA